MKRFSARRVPCSSVGRRRLRGRALAAAFVLALAIAGAGGAWGQEGDGASATPPRPGTAAPSDPLRSGPNTAPAADGVLPGRPGSAPPVPVFFPPWPPALDAPVPFAPLEDASQAAPAELAGYVNEPFYAPLSVLLAQDDVNALLRMRLESYRANKLSLENDLRARLDALQGAAPAERLAALEALAREQAPLITALEESAEELRGALAAAGGDWNEGRTWALGRDEQGVPTDELGAREYRVMRAAVYYQDALLPAQRRLLREVAMELDPAGGGGDAVLFFSPDTTRVQLPAGLPEALAARIAEYAAAKGALKGELRKTVREHDGDSFPFQRNRALRRLAEEQAPRIAALEELAEQIRRDLAALPAVARPSPLDGLPAALAGQLAAYQAEKLALQQELFARVEETRRRLPSFHPAVPDDRRPGPQAFRTPVASEERLRPVRDTIRAFASENAARFASLARQKEVLRGELARYVEGSAAPGRSVDVLLRDFVGALQQREAAPAYREYRLAVFEPGLSPGQRRLLLDAAVEKLGLPLPGGEPWVD